MNRKAFQKLAEARLLDARVLLKAKRYDAADYMAGYVIECALKACIAKRTRRYDFPPKDGRDVYTHELEKLLKVTGIDKLFRKELEQDPQLAANWSAVKDWKPERRYELGGAPAAKEATNFLKAIGDPDHGVLQCLYKYW